MRLRHIKKRTKNLGRFNKELWIRLLNKGRFTVTGHNHYHIVLALRRNKARSRYDKLGYIDTVKKINKWYHEIAFNSKKMYEALSIGAKIHSSVYKLLFM